MSLSVLIKRGQMANKNLNAFAEPQTDLRVFFLLLSLSSGNVVFAEAKVLFQCGCLGKTAVWIRWRLMSKSH